MRRSRTVITSILSLSLVAGTPVAVTSQDVSTPEAAVREYLAGMAAADMERVLAASAVDEAAEGYRLDLVIERVGGYVPLAFQPPADHPFFVDLNRLGLSQFLTAQVRNLAE